MVADTRTLATNLHKIQVPVTWVPFLTDYLAIYIRSITITIGQPLVSYRVIWAGKRKFLNKLQKVIDGFIWSGRSRVAQATDPATVNQIPKEDVSAS